MLLIRIVFYLFIFFNFMVSAYGRDMEEDIITDTSGHFKKMLVVLIQVSVLDKHYYYSSKGQIYPLVGNKIGVCTHISRLISSNFLFCLMILGDQRWVGGGGCRLGAAGCTSEDCITFMMYIHLTSNLIINMWSNKVKYVKNEIILYFRIWSHTFYLHV